MVISNRGFERQSILPGRISAVLIASAERAGVAFARAGGGEVSTHEKPVAPFVKGQGLFFCRCICDNTRELVCTTLHLHVDRDLHRRRSHRNSPRAFWTKDNMTVTFPSDLSQLFDSTQGQRPRRKPMNRLSQLVVASQFVLLATPAFANPIALEVVRAREVAGSHVQLTYGVDRKTPPSARSSPRGVAPTCTATGAGQARH
jgi:hypothetical protein